MAFHRITDAWVCSTSAVVGRRHADAAAERRREVGWVTVSTFEMMLTSVCRNAFHSEACQPTEMVFLPNATYRSESNERYYSQLCLQDRRVIRDPICGIEGNLQLGRVALSHRCADCVRGLSHMTVKQVPRKEVRRALRVQVWKTITCGARQRKHNLRHERIGALRSRKSSSAALIVVDERWRCSVS